MVRGYDQKLRPTPDEEMLNENESAMKRCIRGRTEQVMSRRVIPERVSEVVFVLIVPHEIQYNRLQLARL